MPSLRSTFCRMLTKYLVAPKLNAEKTIEAARQGMENLTKFVILPLNTKVEKITCNGISAEWVYAEAAREDRVVLFLHGGGYNLCSPNTHRELAAHISAVSNARILLPDYRLAPEHPFPAALEDATATYRWLLDKGRSADRMVIAGDSAGGGLSIAAAVALRDAGDPPPAAIACISPWTDLEMNGHSIKTNAIIDPMINLQHLKIFASNYIGGADPRSPLISPIHADLKGISPLLIHVGSDEMLLDDSIRIADKAKEAGVDVTLKIYDHMWHVFHLNARVMPEAKKAVKEFGTFFRKHFEKKGDEHEGRIENAG